MSRLVVPALLAAALLANPLACATHLAVAPPEPFPAELLALLDGWITQAEESKGDHAGKDWASDADDLLTRARAALGEKRFRTGLAYLEAHHETVRTWTEWEPVANLSGPAKTSRILQVAEAEFAAAEQAQGELRRKLDAFEANVSSARGFELALYAGQYAVESRYAMTNFATLRRDATADPNPTESHLFSLLQLSLGPKHFAQWMADVIDLAAKEEGTGPALDREKFANVTGGILRSGAKPQRLSPSLQPYSDAVGDASRTNESVYGMAAQLGLLRATRLQSFQTIYGDAASRGRNVSADLTKNVWKTLNQTNTTLFAGFGYRGLVVMDAQDLATHALRDDAVDVVLLMRAWSFLESARITAGYTGAVSGTKPLPVTMSGECKRGDPSCEPGSKTPGPAAAALLAAVGLGALAGAGGARRRR